MDVEELNQTGVRPYNRIRCNATIMHPPYRHPTHGFRCKHTVAYIVDGEGLCERHAGRKLIAYHLKEKQEEKRKADAAVEAARIQQQLDLDMAEARRYNRKHVAKRKD